ncbi:MAG: CHAT domain-containing tetratricopeptide repeat protein [Ekhidna sp.]
MKIKLILALSFIGLFYFSYSQENEELVKELLKKGKASLQQFQLDSAKSTFDKASQISEKNELWDLYFDAQLNQAMVAFLSRKQVDSDQIIDELYSRVKVNSSLVNDSSIALLNYINANLLWRQSKYLESRKRINEALRLADISRISDGNKAKMLLIEGNINLHLSNYGQAIEGFLNCLNLQPDKENRLSMFVYNNIGQAYSESRNYQRGMEYYLRGLSVCNKLYNPDHPYFGFFYQNIGNLYFLMDDYSNASAYYTKLIDLNERILDPDDPELAKNYNNVAAQMIKESKYDSARIYLNKSFAILGEKNHRNKRHAYNILGQLLSAEERYDEALRNYHVAFSIEREIKDGANHFLTQILMRKGKAYQKLTQYDSAILQYNEILMRISDDWSPVDIEDNPKMKELKVGFEDEAIEALLAKATVMCLTKVSRLGITPTYSLIETLLDKLESDYLSPEEQFNLVGYENELARLKLETISSEFEGTGNEDLIEEAFQSIERNKARILKLELESRHSNNVYRLDEKIFERNRDLLISIGYHKSLVVTSTNQLKIDSLNSIIFDLNRTKDSLETVVRDRFPLAYKKKFGKQETSVKLIQERLQKNNVLVQYFIGDSAIHMLSVSKEGVEFTSRTIPNNLEELIKDASIQAPNQLNSVAFSELYNLLIQPLALADEIDKLTVIPDKHLWNVNFELLLSENLEPEIPMKNWPFLLKQMSIHYVYSASTFTDNELGAGTNVKVLAMSFGDIDEGDGTALIRDFADLGELPGTREEIRRISKHVGGNYYFGKNANESNFKREAPKYSVLHLALHGETQEDNPNNSSLAFYNNEDNMEDGFLHAFELYGLELGAELAVLSACQTGEGPLVNGEGIMSLGRAFSSAGVKSLVVSRWKIPDATAPEIMEAFYQELVNGKSKSEALRLAKIAYLDKADNLTSHPYYWSSFYVLGSDASMDFSSSFSLYFLVLGVVIIVFIAIQIKRRMS